ncbi:ERECTA-like 1 [Hibiscus syriacus]|uniref:ERECTA-like 1 n=1 Tax=Hibiscus syriacus TaxID=106335 RepID=A0A6A3C4B8_HIBSY|nr:ERECTA-like 1 [Hibiscus syriacus]
MVVEIAQEEQFYSIEESIEVGQFFDIEYEFDAPQCYDFSCPETDWEAKEAELWFESAGSYPSSLKLKWRYEYDAYEDGEHDNGSTECDEYNGEACDRCCEGNLRVKTDSLVKASLSRSSTLMKPTASYLAKQNQSRMVVSNQYQKSLQKPADRFNKSTSCNEDDTTKRQKLEEGYLCKAAHLKHRSKATNSNKAQRHRSKDKAESDGNAKSNVHLFKALPLNRKILAAPSFPLSKKSMPQPPEFQMFHLRTSERAKQHAYNTEEKHEAVNKSKACSPNKKVTSSKGVLQNMNKTSATTRLPDEPAKELLNKGSKENEPGNLLLQHQIMEVVKAHLQKNGKVQYQCRREKNIGNGRQDNISRRLRLDVV